jgi:hypothetical protein
VVVVIKAGGCPTGIQALVEEIGLEAEIVTAPIDLKAFWPTEERWVVVGQKKIAVAEKYDRYLEKHKGPRTILRRRRMRKRKRRRLSTRRNNRT